jgi:hypothetical protein
MGVPLDTANPDAVSNPPAPPPPAAFDAPPPPPATTRYSTVEGAPGGGVMLIPVPIDIPDPNMISAMFLFP